MVRSDNLRRVSRSIHLETAIAAPVHVVWGDIARLETHNGWMAEVGKITFLGDQTSGAGTRIAVETRVGPLRTKDVIEFVSWEPPHRMAIRHTGMVTGLGEFTLTEVGDATTRFAWHEVLAFPWYFGGPIDAWLATPVLKRIWRSNLDELASRF